MMMMPLVMVANIKMRTMKTEVEKSSMWTSDGSKHSNENYDDWSGEGFHVNRWRWQIFKWERWRLKWRRVPIESDMDEVLHDMGCYLARVSQAAALRDSGPMLEHLRSAMLEHGLSYPQTNIKSQKCWIWIPFDTTPWHPLKPSDNFDNLSWNPLTPSDNFDPWHPWHLWQL